MKTLFINLALFLSLNGCDKQKQDVSNMPIAGIQSKSIEYDGIFRTYDIFVPPGIEENAPLVIMLHGGGGNSTEAAYSTRWVSKAEKEGFIVVFPNGTREDMTRPASFGKNGQSWNDGSTRGLYATENNIDDVGFIRKLCDTVSETYPVDPQRIYAAGFSNGASMAFRLGVECPDIFAAIAPVSGSLWLDNPVLNNPISIIYITGDSDPLNPYNGGEVIIGQDSFGYKMPVSDLISLWANLLNATKDSDSFEGDVHTVSFKSPAAEVLWITVKGMGHHWPGGNVTLPEWMVGKPSDALDGTNVIWEFFSKKCKGNCLR